jgi:hypothetical protein
VIKHAVSLVLEHLLPTWPEVTETVVNTGRVSTRITPAGTLVNRRGLL